jgi:hypothetical protein
VEDRPANYSIGFGRCTMDPGLRRDDSGAP